MHYIIYNGRSLTKSALCIFAGYYSRSVFLAQTIIFSV